MSRTTWPAGAWSTPTAPARELFLTTRETAPLVTVIRDPRVLEAVDEALFGKIASQTVYETGGMQDRVWGARAAPLGDHGGRGLALLVLRDETELRRSERTRADFLANASHELRTPLASLAGFIETLRGHAREDASARDRFLAIMQDQAGRMARLIEDLMSLSRIELNEHVPPNGRADLRMTARDVLDALAPLAAGKQVRFDLSAPDRPGDGRAGRPRPGAAGDPEPGRERPEVCPARLGGADRDPDGRHRRGGHRAAPGQAPRACRC